MDVARDAVTVAEAGDDRADALGAAVLTARLTIREPVHVVRGRQLGHQSERTRRRFEHSHRTAKPVKCPSSGGRECKLRGGIATEQPAHALASLSLVHADDEVRPRHSRTRAVLRPGLGDVVTGRGQLGDPRPSEPKGVDP